MASIQVLLAPWVQSCSGPGGSVMRMWTKSEEGGMLVPSLERRWMWRYPAKGTARSWLITPLPST